MKLKEISEYIVFDGVSIFFVLSGFLIGGILIKIIDKNKISSSLMFNFWIRRWFRTLPNYFLILITLSLLNYFFNEGFTFRMINRFFYFSQNINEIHPSWFFPEAWSLSIEEWFYLIIPLLIFAPSILFKISSKKTLLLTIFGVIIISTLFRYHRFSLDLIHDINDCENLLRKQVITRVDSLMFGLLGAYINFYYFDKWIKYKKSFLILGISYFLIAKFILPYYINLNSLYFTVFSFTLTSISTLLLIPFLSNWKKTKSILYKPITYISLISYSMYLINNSIIQK